MADYQTLFHNPEALTDADLGILRRNIMFQKIFVGSCILGFAALPTLMGKPMCYKRTAATGLVGLAFGAQFAGTALGGLNVTKYSQGA